MKNICNSARQPLVHPIAFDESLEQTTFTNGDDRDTVKKLYKMFFHEIMSSVTRLVYEYLNCCADHYKAFVKILPACVNLQTLV